MSLIPRFFWRYREPQYLRAAHYFGDGWPLDSLMVMRQPELKRDLTQLRDDGFNAIVLVVPWRALQTGTKPPTYDPFYLDQLQLTLREAEVQRMAVLLRVSYTHQLMLGPAVNGIRFAQQMLLDPEVEHAWLDCQRQVMTLAAASPSFAGAFVSWEELWHAFANWQRESPTERKRLARRSGFLDYAAGKESGLDRIPLQDEPGHAVYLDFSNARIRDLFTKAREQCTQLGVEYRVDRDPVQTDEGVLWQRNDAFADFAPARYAYWAPFMGADNSGGERLDPQQALSSLEGMLKETTDGGAVRGLVLEQFNFIDSTRKYAEIHARIDEDGIATFLRKAASVLTKYTTGYGVWAPRDYRCNVLFNAALLDSGRGWSLDSALSSFQTNGGVVLGEQGGMSQQLRPKVAGVPRPHPFDALTLRVAIAVPSMPPRLRARINGGSWADLELIEEPTEGQQTLEASVPVVFESLFDSGLYFELVNDGSAQRIERLHLYNSVYYGAIRDADGSPGPYLKSIRQLNRSLRKPRPSKASR